MTPAERQQSLENARRACEWLARVAGAFDSEPREEVKCLVAEFQRLDTKEQNQRKAGKKGKAFGHLGAIHGAKGGRPRKNGGKK